MAVALAVFTGVAVAGNGNGNTGGAPGNSESAPGQLKKQEQPAPAAETAPGQLKQAQSAPAVTSAPAAQPQQASEPSTPPGQEKKSAAPSSQPSSNLPGIKPSNTTNAVKPTHAEAGLGKTKKYGNGNTAGNIAMSRGAAPNTDLYGPGNSQPHKVWDCRRGHWVDVHAVKSYANSPADCTPVQQQLAPSVSSHTESTCEFTTTTSTETVVKGIVHHTGSAKNPTVVLKANKHALGAHGDTLLVETITTTTKTPTGANCGAPLITTNVVEHEQPTVTTPAAAALQPTTTVVPATVSGTAAATPATTATPAPAPAATPASQGGVLGAQATLKPTATAKPKPTTPHGVLGTTARIASGKLPFTGIELWVFVLAAGAVLTAGYALRRSGRGTL